MPVCQQWINIYCVDESRCIFVMLVTQTQYQRWKKTKLCVGAPSEANDWQAGELVATGSGNEDLSPATHYTSHITSTVASMGKMLAHLVYFSSLCIREADRYWLWVHKSGIMTCQFLMIHSKRWEADIIQHLVL